MAKLSAHGYEVARVRVTLNYPWSNEPGAALEGINEFSYRSDGFILKKHTAVFRGYKWESAPTRRHSTGWTIHNRFSDRTITPERIQRAAEAHLDRINNRDYEVPDTTMEATIS